MESTTALEPIAAPSETNQINLEVHRKNTQVLPPQSATRRESGPKASTATIFSNLCGTWRLRRSLQSVLPGFPSGTFQGQATFTPRTPSSASAHRELLYAEEGELRTDEGLTLRANRKYIYRFDADEEKISAWFVTEDSKQRDGGEVVDYLFHDLEMVEGPEMWQGRGEHLCELDMYWAYYEFHLKGETMDLFGVKYKVVGPRKDYTTDAAYERV